MTTSLGHNIVTSQSPVLPWEHCSSGWSNLKRHPGRVPSLVQFWNGVGIMAVTSSPFLTSAYISGYMLESTWIPYTRLNRDINTTYLYIDVVSSSVWSHNVFIFMVMGTHTLLTKRVSGIAAYQICIHHRDTDLWRHTHTHTLFQDQLNLLDLETHYFSCYYLYQREVEGTM